MSKPNAMMLRHPCRYGHAGPFVPMPHMTEWYERIYAQMHLDKEVGPQVRCLACLSDITDPEWRAAA